MVAIPTTAKREAIDVHHLSKLVSEYEILKFLSDTVAEMSLPGDEAEELVIPEPLARPSFAGKRKEVPAPAPESLDKQMKLNSFFIKN